MLHELRLKGMCFDVVIVSCVLNECVNRALMLIAYYELCFGVQSVLIFFISYMYIDLCVDGIRLKCFHFAIQYDELNVECMC